MNNLAKALIIVVIVIGAVVAFLNMGGKDKTPGLGNNPPTDITSSAEDPGTEPPIDTTPIPTADQKAVDVSGVVKNDQDQVLSGARVFAYELGSAGGGSERKLIAEKSTDDTGEFTMPSLRPGKYLMIASAEGLQEDRKNVTLIPDQEPAPIEFVLGSGLSISGKVYSVVGEPIAGATVRAFLERVEENASLQDQLSSLLHIQELKSEEGIAAVTDDAGYYEIKGLEQGTRYRLRCIASQHSPKTKRHIRAGKKEVDFSLLIGGELTGLVRSTSGTPIEGAELSVYRQPKEGAEVNIIEVVLQSLYPPLAKTVSGPSGEYVFDQLGDGTQYKIVAVAPGHQVEEAEKIVVKPGAVTTLDLDLAVGHTISGYVYAPSGAALADATVKVNLTGARPKSTQMSIESLEQVTDDSGYFTFDTLEDGEYRVVTSHADFATHQQNKVKPEVAELSIVLEPGAAISGTVSDASTGSPIAGATVTVRDLAGIEKPATTDANGYYIVRGVSVPRRGEARLGCQADGYAREGNATAPVTADSLTDGVDFAMRANGTVSGVIVDSNGKKVAGARVEVKRQNDPKMPIFVTVGGPVTTSANGSYTIENVAPGLTNYVVGRHPEYLESESEAFDLEPGGVADGMQVELRLGGMITGVVVDEADQPLAGARVGLKNDRVGDVPIESLEKKAVTDASGRFSIGSVEPGDATLVAHLDGYLRIEMSGIGVAEGRATSDLTLKLTQGRTLSGYVLDTGDHPIIGAKVTVIDTSDGLNKPHRRTDSNGYYQFNELGEYPVQINVEKQGYSKEQRHEVPVQTENNNFVLRRLGTLVGVVVNQHGEPLTTFSVAPKINENGRVLQRQPARTFNSTDGTFEYPGINPGVYQIVIGCPGFAATTLESVSVSEDIATDLGRIELNEGGKIGGFVVDAETGEPVIGATVSVKGGASAVLRNPFGKATDGRRPGRRSGVIGRKRTDAEGYFLIAGLAQDIVTVEIEHKDYMKGTVELQAGALETEITLSRGGVISGRVIGKDDGAGRGGISLYLVGEGRNDRQVSNRKGSFTFSGLQDGAYEIRATTFGLVGSGKTSMRDVPVHRVEVRNGAAPFLEILYDGPAGRGEDR